MEHTHPSLPPTTTQTPNTQQHRKRWVSPFYAFQYQHGEGDGEHNPHTTTTPLPPHLEHFTNIISFTTQCLTHNYMRKGEFHIFLHFNTNMEREMENTPYKHPTTMPLPPPHTQEHITIQVILSQLEHGDGDGAYTPTPTTHHHPNS